MTKMKTKDATLMLTFPSDREIVITRVFDAPRQLVFEAWTKPEHVRQWYGPSFLTMTVCEIDLRVGGQWRYVLQAADGREYAFSGEYREIVSPERLVSTEWYEAIPGADYLVTAAFDEHAGKTTLTTHLRYRSQEYRDGHINAGMEDGMRATLARLDAHLAAMANAEREIVIARTFDAPRDLVFQVWTDPSHVDQWWGPSGFRNATFEMDVRPGGVWRYVMHGPDGVDYENQIVYDTIVKPEQLSYTHGSGAVDDPDQFQVTVTFTEQDDKTVLTMRMRFVSAAARKQVVETFGAIEGANQTLNRLAEYLGQLG